MLLTNKEEYWDYITTQIYNFDAIDISTFGLGLGCELVGSNYRHPLRDILRSFNGKKVRMLIGLPYGVDEAELKQDIKPFDLKFKFRQQHHAKCWIFKEGRKAVKAIIGGHNFCLSNSVDVSIVVQQTQAQELSRYFNGLWKN